MLSGLFSAGDGWDTSRLVRVAILGAALGWLLYWYRDTASSMVAIWERSGTFAHGYLVVPISLWLIWRRRHHLQGLPLDTSGWGILVGAVAGFAWLLGQLGSVDSVSQFALVSMVIALVWAIMGTSVLRAYAFPLGFLFFCVPFGEFLFPTMMDWTTHFVVGALRLSGVPVYAEGRSLVIPSGTWQVVEGCSGIRYLIASIVVGSLYAYLNYRSVAKRLIFTAVSVVLPILANWVRAWGIVMLGHLSNNKIATGVDHIIYGWVFFGIIIMLLFWVGARWREDEAPPPILAFGMARGNAGSAGAAIVWVLVAFVAVLAWRPVLSELERRSQQGVVRFATLASHSDWQQVQVDRLPEWLPSYSGMRGVAHSAWMSRDRLVGLYVGYYRDQKPGAELVNSENRVLISKDPVWRMAAYGDRVTDIGGRPVKLGSLEMIGRGGRMLVWHGYWIGGRWTTNEYLAKLYLAASQLRGEGDDSAAVMLYTPFAEGELNIAEATLGRFFGEMGQALNDMLAQTTLR